MDRGSGPRTTESLQVVSEQLNHLHTRLRVHEREFDALCATSASSTSENMRLKSELQRLEALNEAERCELENKLNTVIHGHSSEPGTAQSSSAGCRLAAGTDPDIPQNLRRTGRRDQSPS